MPVQGGVAMKCDAGNHHLESNCPACGCGASGTWASVQRSEADVLHCAGLILAGDCDGFDKHDHAKLVSTSSRWSVDIDGGL